jgi:hypothetical protein
VGLQREPGLPLPTERLELRAFWALIERESGDLIGDAGLGLIEGSDPSSSSAVRGARCYLTVSVPSMPAALWLPTGQ